MRGYKMQGALYIFVASVSTGLASEIHQCNLDGCDPVSHNATIIRPGNPLHWASILRFGRDLHYAFATRRAINVDYIRMSAQRRFMAGASREGATTAHPSYALLMWSLLQLADRPRSTAGHWLEFGVFRGRSINGTRFFLESNVTVVGFDTFHGLPEKWGGMKKGFFTLEGRIPPVRPGVKLEVGLFNATLPPFLLQRPDLELVGVNIDCDLYSSTLDVLFLLHPFFRPGTLLHFHEIVIKHYNARPPQPSSRIMATENVMSTYAAQFRALTDEASALRNYLLACDGVVLDLLPHRGAVPWASVFRVRSIDRTRPCDTSILAPRVAANVDAITKARAALGLIM